MPYGRPPSQKHVHMCMFLRIAQILIQIMVSNLAPTAPGTDRPPRARSSLASVSTNCNAKWRLTKGPFQAQYARDRDWSLFHHGPASLSHDQLQMDVRWMSSSIALLASPEILKFRAQKILEKILISAGRLCRTAHPHLKNMFTCACF